MVFVRFFQGGSKAQMWRLDPRAWRICSPFAVQNVVECSPTINGEVTGKRVQWTVGITKGQNPLHQFTRNFPAASPQQVGAGKSLLSLLCRVVSQIPLQRLVADLLATSW